MLHEHALVVVSASSLELASAALGRSVALDSHLANDILKDL